MVPRNNVPGYNEKERKKSALKENKNERKQKRHQNMNLLRELEGQCRRFLAAAKITRTISNPVWCDTIRTAMYTAAHTALGDERTPSNYHTGKKKTNTRQNEIDTT